MINSIFGLAGTTTAVDPVAQITTMLGTVDFSVFTGIVTAVLTAVLGVSIAIIGLTKGYKFLLNALQGLY